jgi:hypothetical protein
MFNSGLQDTYEIRAITERQQELSARVARLAPVDGMHQTAFAPLALTSQFSREYRRLFGAPPRAEVARLRESGLPA